MEEKETIHVNLLTELTGNLISEESEWEEDWSESDEYGMPNIHLVIHYKD